ncbi:hypothetical protein RUM43_001496 [Polyplax serrata]|uniref:Uncharacterized protein n=1 Tax=Polyplax serrata TaxID=468196 RepID=A0AAN8XQT3_POLSC
MPANEGQHQRFPTPSNIPVPKKFIFGSSKKQKPREFPDLHKYVDSVVKASKDTDDVTPDTKLKTDENEVVDSGKQNEEKKLQKKTPDSYSLLEIENFLKKLYPSPFHLEKANPPVLKNPSTKLSPNPHVNDEDGRTETQNIAVQDNLLCLENPSCENKCAVPCDLEFQKSSKNVDKKEDAEVESSGRQAPSKITTREKKNRTTSRNECPEKYKRSKLDLLTTDDDCDDEQRKMKSSSTAESAKPKENLDKTDADLVETYRHSAMVEFSDSDRLSKAMARKDLKKLQEIMDKTDESIQLISKRNKQELLARKESEARKKAKKQEKESKQKLMQFIEKVSISSLSNQLLEISDFKSSDAKKKCSAQESTKKNNEREKRFADSEAGNPVAATAPVSKVVDWSEISSKSSGASSIASTKRNGNNLVREKCGEKLKLYHSRMSSDVSESSSRENNIVQSVCDYIKKLDLDDGVPEEGHKKTTKTLFSFRQRETYRAVKPERHFDYSKERSKTLCSDKISGRDDLVDMFSSETLSTLTCDLSKTSLDVPKYSEQTGPSLASPLPAAEGEIVENLEMTLPMVVAMANNQEIAPTLAVSNVDIEDLAENEPENETNDELQLVENTNELGGYNEETPNEILAGGGDVSPKKNLLPFSVKIRKMSNESSKALKKALENEEKLFVNHVQDVQGTSSLKNVASKEETNDTTELFPQPASDAYCRGRQFKESSFYLKSCDSDMLDAYPFFKHFNVQNSNFVICVNSLPRNLRTIVRPNIMLASSYPTAKTPRSNDSVSDATVCCGSQYTRRQFEVFPRIIQTTSTYGMKEEILTVNTLDRVTIFGTSALISIELSVKCSRYEENHIKNSECSLEYGILPVTKAMSKNLSERTSNALVNTETTEFEFEFIGKQSKQSTIAPLDETESVGREEIIHQDPKLNTLVEAIKKAEENIQMLEENLETTAEEFLQNGNEMLPWRSASEPFNDKVVIRYDTENNENKKKKVEDLLTRTYSIQRKLHGHLYRISSEKYSTHTIPLPNTYEIDRSNEVSMMNNYSPFEAIELNSKSMQTDDSFPTICWFNTRTSSTVINSVEDTTRVGNNGGTPNNKTEPIEFHKNVIPIGNNLTDVAHSSTSSFKSSKDFSECDENQIKDIRSSNVLDLKNISFLGKIFSDLEMFTKKLKPSKQTFTPDQNSDAKVPQKVVSNESNNTEQLEKMPAKILKTIFKGKESMTELAIGLKDVPMSNISVEKKKFSPNHTKISISITKNRTEDENMAELSREQDVTVHKGESKGMEFYQDNLKILKKVRAANDSFGGECDTKVLKEPCLSPPKRIEEEDEEEEEDDGDFKSVGSSFSEPESLEECNPVEKKKPMEKKTEQSGVKPYRKHRFDFYQKMSNDYSLGRASRSYTRYDVKDVMCRELEPLRQALTDMQMRMRSLKRTSLLGSQDYYDRALKLAKMSAGYCQNCGNRAVIPEDTFGYYKSILPRRYSSHHLKYYMKNDSNYYSFRSCTDLNEPLCDMDLRVLHTC